VDGEEDAVRAVRDLSGLDRRKIRTRFDQRFTSERMARDYEARYRVLIAEALGEAHILEEAAAD
jgi:hypothetical protein